MLGKGFTTKERALGVLVWPLTLAVFIHGFIKGYLRRD